MPTPKRPPEDEVATRIKKQRHHRKSNAVFRHVQGMLKFGRDHGHSFDYEAAADHFDIDPDSICWIVATADQQWAPGMCHDYCNVQHMPGHETLGAAKHHAAIHLRARLKPVRRLFFTYAQQPQPQASTDDDDLVQECTCVPPCDPAWSDTAHGSHGFNCEVVWQRDLHNKHIIPAQRRH